MTTFTISGAHASGVTVSNKYNAVDILAAATVGGTGVYVTATASVANYGAVTASNGLGVNGIYLNLGGVINNYGTITGFNGVKSTAGAFPQGTVQNSGTIGGYFDGIQLLNGGYVRNFSTSTISGGHSAIYITAGKGTVNNYGVIEGVYSSSSIIEDAAISITIGYVTNTGTITGRYGVEASGAANIFNLGTIAGNDKGAVLANGGTVTNGETSVTTATISSNYGTAVSVSAGSVANYGAITTSKYGVLGVALMGGSTLTNGALTDRSALIKAPTGVETFDAASSVYNRGTIISAGYGGGEAGVVLGGGRLYNGSGADTSATIEAYRNSAVTVFGAGTVTNYGFIDGAGGAASGDYGAVFTNGGVFVNGSNGSHAALIEGYVAVAMTGAAGTVQNFGTIRSLGVTASAPGVTLAAGGVVNNGAAFAPAAQIQGYAGVGFGGAGTLNNFGAISVVGLAAHFSAAGTVTNGAGTDQTALMSGYVGVLSNGAVAVTNFGTIRSTAATFGAVSGNVGGKLTNGSGGDSAALLAGAFGVWLDTSGALGAADLGTVVNYGTIEASIGQGVRLGGGGSVTNGSRATFTGRIDGYGGVAIYGAAGTVSNYGTIAAGGGLSHPAITLAAGGRVVNGFGSDTAALISGVTAVDLGAAGTVVNFATINGQSGYGVVLRGGGAVTNGGGVDRSALIQGYIAIEAKALTTISNSGTVISTAASHYGVYMTAGGALTNGSLSNATALIEGAGGVALVTGGAVGNFATIWGASDTGGAGAYLTGGASLTNGAAGDAAAVTQGFTGVHAGAAATVTNFGTIRGFGGVAVLFNAASDVLAVEAGSTFIGSVNGGGGTLDLASGTGTITSLLVGGKVTETGSATTFANFGTLEVGAGASFTVSGSGTIAAGQGLIVAGTLTEAGTLTIAGSLTTTGTLAGTGTLALTGGTSNFNTGTALTIAKVTQSGGTANSGSTSLNYAGLWTQTAGTVSASASDKFGFTGVGDTFLGTLAGAGTVAFTGGTDALTGTTIKAAHVTIGAATVTLSGTISNASVVNVTDPSVIVAAAGASLTGAGSINLSNVATNMIKGATAGSTLTNVSNKITGAGNLGGGQMTLVNQVGGTINGNLSLGLTIDTGANAIANAGIIENTATGGTTVKSAVVNTGYLIVTKGVLAVNGAVTGAGTVKIGGGTADFASTFTENVVFTSTTGVLELSHSQTYTGSVTGFSHTGTSSLDLLDIGFTAGTTKAAYVGTVASGVLTVTDGTHTAKIGFTGDYTAATWTVSSDGHGGTTVVDPTKSAVTQPHAPLLGFIAAAAGFGASPAASSALAGGWHELRPALALPRTHLA